jgi:hypothetical protein
MEENMSRKTDNNVSNVNIKANITGCGNIVGENISINGYQLIISQGNIGLNEYENSINDFSKKLNEILNKIEITKDNARNLKCAINELKIESKDIGSNKNITYNKKMSIHTKLTSVVNIVLNILPGASEGLLSFTPLAPYGKIIGITIDELVKLIKG